VWRPESAQMALPGISVPENGVCGRVRHPGDPWPCIKYAGHAGEPHRSFIGRGMATEEWVHDDRTE